MCPQLEAWEDKGFRDKTRGEKPVFVQPEWTKDTIPSTRFVEFIKACKYNTLYLWRNESEELIMRRPQRLGKMAALEAGAVGGDFTNLVVYENVFEALFELHHGVEHQYCFPKALHEASMPLYGPAITFEACEAFIKNCPHCKLTSKSYGIRAGGNPIIEMAPFRRIQLDCIDYQSEHADFVARLQRLSPDDPERQAWHQDDASYKNFLQRHSLRADEDDELSIVPRYIVTIGDHFSKLRRYFAVASKRPPQIAQCLVLWVSMYGPFDVLHADNGTDVMRVGGFDPKLQTKDLSLDEKCAEYRVQFSSCQQKSIIDHVRYMIPGILCVHGLPCHSESQGFIENCNKFARSHLREYMATFETSNWWSALPNLNYVALTRKNAAIGMSPFECLFATKPRTVGGLAQLRMTDKLVKSFWCEGLIVNYLMHGGSPGLLEDMYRDRPGCNPLNMFHPDLASRIKMKLPVTSPKPADQPLPPATGGYEGVSYHESEWEGSTHGKQLEPVWVYAISPQLGTKGP